MFIDCATASEHPDLLVYRSDSLADLYDHDRLRNKDKRADLLCLQPSDDVSAVTALMDSPLWPSEFIEGLQLPTGCQWLIATDGSGDRPMKHEDNDLLNRASGQRGAPVGNVRCTLPIRRYDDRSSAKGDLCWISAWLAMNSIVAGLAVPVLSYLHCLLRSAQNAGAGLMVEQLSLIIAKDADADNSCLTPRLHADEYYGRRETAILSFLEPGWSMRGGTWFLPGHTMSLFQDGDMIRPSHMDSERFGDIPVVFSSHGELCIYDGMQDALGKVSPLNGLPHISGDIPGSSSRLLVLFNHESIY